MRLAPELGPPAGLAGSGRALGAVARRAGRLGAATLGTALVAVYAGAALTLPAGQGSLGGALTAVAGAELALVLALLRSGARRGVLGAGAALQLGLAVAWVLSRTAGLLGQGTLPVGELDLICLLDELVLGALCLAGLRAPRPRSGLRALAPCQVAVTLAGATLFAWGGGHVHGVAATAAADGVQFGGPAHVRYYCHLL